MRNFAQAFNESQVLGFMIYCHLLFLTVRIVTGLMTGGFSSRGMMQIWSILFSLDTLVTIAVYFVPKFLAEDDTSARSWVRVAFSLPPLS